MRERFLKEIQRIEKFPDKKILLAVSAGVDSMVLLDLLVTLPVKIRPQIHLAHIQHFLRDEDEEEAHFVKMMAKRYNLPVYFARWEKALHPQAGIELAARNFRYKKFSQWLDEIDGDILMTAHHKSDQAETVLMRLVRGGRLERLEGIKAIQNFRNKILWRPLLSFSKSEIYNYATENDLKYYEDASNEELIYTRNRFRHQVLPELKKENPQVEKHLADLAVEMQNNGEVLAELIAPIYRQLVKKEHLNLKGWRKQSKILQRYLLKNFIDAQDPGEWSIKHLELIQEWLSGTTAHSRYDLNKEFWLEKSYQKLYLQKKLVSEDKSIIELQVNSWHPLDGKGLLGWFDKDYVLEVLPNDQVYLTNDGQRFYLRHRQNGDRMSMKGRLGTRKVKDIFIDQKVALPDRSQAWLLLDEEERLHWLVDYKESALSSSDRIDKIEHKFIYRRIEEKKDDNS